MAIFGIGSFYEEDVTDSFLSRQIACVGHRHNDAPSLHKLIESIKVGDILYIKAHPPAQGLIIKAIGIILDDEIQRIENVGEICRNVRWIWQGNELVGRVEEKYNVRNNTLYEEYNPSIQKRILELLLSRF